MAGGETGARQAERWADACRSGGGGGGAAITAPLVSGLSMFLPHPSSLLLPDVWFFIVQCPLEFAICWRHVGVFHSICWRPYHVECTGSLLTSEVKRHRARLVLGWGTAWEDLRVLSAFAPAGPESFDRCVFGVCSVCWGKGVAGWVAGAKCRYGFLLVFALVHVDGSPWSS